MGCDIHLYREKSVAGQWVSADEWTDYADEGTDVDYKKRAYTGRNYDLFGLLSRGVRREFALSLQQRGMPFDASPEVSKANEQWDGDGHSHSYLYLHELKSLAAFLKTTTIPISGMKDRAGYEKLQASIASGTPDWDLLYPYCQMTTDRSAVEFKVDVPAAWGVGDGLDQIIASFDGIEGDNHRIVFWFDN